MIKVDLKDLSRLLDFIVDDAPGDKLIKNYSKSDFMGHRLLFKLCEEQNWCHVLVWNDSENQAEVALFDLYIENTVEIHCNLETKAITIVQEDKTFFTRVFLIPYIAVEMQKAMCEEYVHRSESI
jgi:GTPase involved in cell partitioning and DNA repair